MVLWWVQYLFLCSTVYSIGTLDILLCEIYGAHLLTEHGHSWSSAGHRLRRHHRQIIWCKKLETLRHEKGWKGKIVYHNWKFENIFLDSFQITMYQKNYGIKIHKKVKNQKIWWKTPFLIQRLKTLGRSFKVSGTISDKISLCVSWINCKFWKLLLVTFNQCHFDLGV